MSDKASIILMVTVIILLMLLGITNDFYSFDNPVLASGWLLAKITAAWMMFTHGTFKDRRYFYLAYGLGAAIGLGLSFKILHYSGGDEILTISLLGMPALYLVHFLSKKQKRVLDVLKVLTVFLQFIFPLLIITHRMEGHTWVSFLPSYCFWFTFVYYITLSFLRKTLYV